MNEFPFSSSCTRHNLVKSTSFLYYVYANKPLTTTGTSLLTLLRLNYEATNKDEDTKLNNQQLTMNIKRVIKNLISLLGHSLHHAETHNANKYSTQLDFIQ